MGEIATIQEQTTQLQAFGDISAAMGSYAQVSKALMSFASQSTDINGKPIVVVIQGGQKYMRVEGWQFLARAFGLATRISDLKRIPGDPETWQATAEVVDRSGSVVGSAISLCDRTEPGKKAMPSNALASMAQTRACAKSLRQVLSFVAMMAGFEPTPVEEMDFNADNARDIRNHDPVNLDALRAELLKVKAVDALHAHYNRHRERIQKAPNRDAAERLYDVREDELGGQDAVSQMDEMPA